MKEREQWHGPENCREPFLFTRDDLPERVFGSVGRRPRGLVHFEVAPGRERGVREGRKFGDGGENHGGLDDYSEMQPDSRLK